jgi:hypothetical protein
MKKEKVRTLKMTEEEERGEEMQQFSERVGMKSCRKNRRFENQ